MTTPPAPIPITLGVPVTFAISVNGADYNVTFMLAQNATGGISINTDINQALETDSGQIIDQG